MPGKDSSNKDRQSERHKEKRNGEQNKSKKMKNDSWKDEIWNLNLQSVLSLIFWILGEQNLIGFFSTAKRVAPSSGNGIRQWGRRYEANTDWSPLLGKYGLPKPSLSIPRGQEELSPGTLPGITNKVHLSQKIPTTTGSRASWWQLLMAKEVAAKQTISFIK